MLAPWLRPEEFDYVPVRKGRAEVRLLALLEAGVGPPLTSRLMVRGTTLRSEHPSLAFRIAERADDHFAWLVKFELPLDVVQAQGARFTLAALGRLPIALPSPLLALSASEERDESVRRFVDPRTRRYLVALGAGVAVATASTAGASAAAASPAPVVTAPPSSPATTGSSSPSAPVKQPAKTKPAVPGASTKAAPHRSKGVAKPPTHPATPAHTPAHQNKKHSTSLGTALKITRPDSSGNNKHSTSLGTALKITRPDSADICQRILLLPPAERKAALKRAWHDGARRCDLTPQSKTKKHKHRKHHKTGSHDKQRATGKRPATHSNPPATHIHKPAVPPEAPASHPRKPVAHVHHASGGAGLPTPRPLKPHVIVPTQPQPDTVAATPPAATPPAVTPPSAVTVWDGGFNIDPFSAAQLKHFSNLVAQLDQPPRFLIPIYKAAGRRFHVQWQILAAINAIETNFGRDLAVSPAGAIGWMQFMPGTWMQYGMAADGDHRPNPYNPRDAIFSAARYLAVNGAPNHIRRALFAYNHAQWYVDAVLWRAQLISEQALGKHIRGDGYALPLDERYMQQLGRTDDGVDIEDAPDGAAVYSITPGIVAAVASDPTGFGPNYPVILATKGPLAGQYIYYGHVAASLVHVGQHVLAGQPIAVMGHTGDAASLGHGHIEIGFSDASGDPLNHHGLVAWTPSGDAMRHILVGLTNAFRSIDARAAGARRSRLRPVQQPLNVLLSQSYRWIGAHEQRWS